MMKKYTLILAVVSAVIFLFVLLGFSGSKTPVQEGSGEREKTSAAAETGLEEKPLERYRAVKGSDVLDYELLNYEGIKVGTVHDLLLDLSTGFVNFIVMDLNGTDEKYYPIPTDFLVADRAAKVYIADIEDMQVLENVPTISERIRQGRALQSRMSGRKVHIYWGNAGASIAPGVMRAPSRRSKPLLYSGGMKLVPGSQASYNAITGYDVMSPQGMWIARIDEILFNLENGRVYYLCASFKGEPGGVQGSIPLPLSAFTLNSRNSQIIFDLIPEKLENAPTVSDMGKMDEESIGRVQSYWNMVSPAAALRLGMRVVPGPTMRATDMLGYTVTNLRGDVLGRIKDFIVSRDGYAPYAAIEFAGILGFDGKWNYIPTAALTLNRVNLTAIVDIDEGVLESMPGFESGALPDTTDPIWDQEIRRSWARWLSPALSKQTLVDTVREERMNGKRAFLMNNLMNYDVISPDGEDLGEIEDIVIDTEDTDIAYVVLAFGGVLEFGEKLFTVPSQALDVNDEDEKITLGVDRKTLERAPHFERDRWPDMSNPWWYSEAEQYWKK